MTGSVVQFIETDEELTDLVKTYTKAVAEKPSKFVYTSSLVHYNAVLKEFVINIY